jgi:hypothetical protein
MEPRTEAPCHSLFGLFQADITAKNGTCHIQTL